MRIAARLGSLRARRGIALAGVAAFAGLGCAATAPAGGAKHCAPPSLTARVSFASDPPPPLAAPHDEHIAALLGVHDVYAARHGAPASGGSAADADVRIVARFELARLVIASTTAEIHCEAERAEQVSAYLAQREASASKGFTIASVLVGAATGVASAFLSASNASTMAQESVALSGGGAGVALGLGALFVHPRVELLHPRNQLKDVWLAPAVAATFPPLVWAYLSRPEFTNDKTQSLRDRIVARWRQFDALDGDAELVALLFGAGGSYDASDLRTRGEMLEELETEVDLMNQDIADLASAIEAR